MNKRLHCLIGRLVCLLLGAALREVENAGNHLLVRHILRQQFRHACAVVSVLFQRGFEVLRLRLRHQFIGVRVTLRVVQQQLQRTGEVHAVALDERLFHAGRHAVIEVHNRLTAVLIVLVCLNRNARQRRVGRDVLRLTQIAVPRGEAALEQALQFNLTARRRQRVEVHVMNVDIAIHVRLTKSRIHDVLLVILLCAFAAEFEHCAHGSIAIDVGVLALDVGFAGILEHNVPKRAHQAGVHLADAAALGAIEDVGLRRAGEAVAHQHLLHRVLHLLHAGDGADVLVVLQQADNFLRQLAARLMPARTARCLKRRENGLLNLVLIKRNFASVAFANHINAHGRCLHHSLFYPYYFPFENQLITSRSFGINCGCFLLPMLHIVSAKQERKPSYTTGAALVNAESGRNGQPKTARSAASPVNRTASTGGENRAKKRFFCVPELSPPDTADLSVLCACLRGVRM